MHEFLRLLAIILFVAFFIHLWPLLLTPVLFCTAVWAIWKIFVTVLELARRAFIHE